MAGSRWRWEGGRWQQADGGWQAEGRDGWRQGWNGDGDHSRGEDEAPRIDDGDRTRSGGGQAWREWNVGEGRSRGWNEQSWRGVPEEGWRTRSAGWEAWGIRFEGQGAQDGGGEDVDRSRGEAPPTPPPAQAMPLPKARAPPRTRDPPRPLDTTPAMPAAYDLDRNAHGWALDGCTCPCSDKKYITSTKTRDMEYFKALSDFPETHNDHNACLKWLRHKHVHPTGFILPDKFFIARMQHWQGESFTFLDTEQVEWSWEIMIAALTEDSMSYVVTGPEGRSRGVVSCQFSPRPNSYDDITSRAIRKEDLEVPKMLVIWDFLITRDDGSSVRLHPVYKHRKFKCFPGEGHPEQVEPPPKGFGKSRGRGSCQAYLNEDVLCYLHFDANKKPARVRPSPPPRPPDGSMVAIQDGSTASASTV